MKTEWTNPNISCTSSIPVVTDDDVLFCLGKRRFKDLQPQQQQQQQEQQQRQEQQQDKYTIEAIDWNTGESLFFIEISNSLLVNSLYASTGIGNNNDIVMGTLGGVLRVSNIRYDKKNYKNYYSYKGLKISNEKGKDVVEKLLKDNNINYFDELASMFVKGIVPSKLLL